jgi:hypothetical protein
VQVQDSLSGGNRARKGLGEGHETELKGRIVRNADEREWIMVVFIRSFPDHDVKKCHRVPILSQEDAYNHSIGTALSDHILSLSQASQSDFVVGKSPMPLTFHIPNANISMLHAM